MKPHKWPLRLAAMIACLGSMCLCCTKENSSPSTSSIRAELLVLTRSLESSNGRISGGFSCSPIASRNPLEESKPFRELYWKTKECVQKGSSQCLQDLGVLQLLLRNIDTSIQLLENAQQSDVTNASLLSDLAVAYLAKSSRGDKVFNVKALEASYRATRLDPSFPEARFNWALALERNFLNREALLAWQKYLKYEPDPECAKEATRHLRTLGKPSRLARWNQKKNALEITAARALKDGDLKGIVRESPYLSRTYAEQSLDLWANSIVKRSAKALNASGIARGIGEVLAQEHYDYWLSDFFASLDRYTSENELSRLAEVYRLSRIAYNLCTSNQGSHGSEVVVQARQTLVPPPAHFEILLSYIDGVCAYEQSNYRNAARKLETLLRSTFTNRYPILKGKAYWLLGMSYLSLAEPAHSLGMYKHSLEVFESARYIEDASAVKYLLSENLAYLGQEDQAWSLIYEGTSEIVRGGDLRRQYAAFDQLADAAAEDGYIQAALLFRSRVVAIAFADPDPSGITHALLRRGEVYLALNDHVLAKRDIETARKFCDNIADKEARRRRGADIFLAEARERIKKSPASARHILSEAQKIYSAIDNRFYMIDLLQIQADASLLLNDTESAEHFLLMGIRELERQREEINPELRLTYFAQARAIFDQMIDLQLRYRRSASESLNYAEASRARALLDQTHFTPASGVRPLDIDSIRRSLPRQITVIEYQMLPDRLVAWVIRSRDLKWAETSIGSQELEDLVSTFYRSLEQGVWDSRVSAKLYKLLIDPIRKYLPEGERLIFVPDGDLELVPFAALYNSATHRFMVEDYLLGTAPSSTSYVVHLKKARNAVDPSRESVLLLGNPDIDRRLFPWLADLPATEREINRIASLYGKRCMLLVGASATRSRFLKFANHHSIIHIAAHSLGSPFPNLAGLALSSSLGDDDQRSVLYAHELSRLRFTGPRLIILAGCATGRGLSLRGEGNLSMARAFIAAGIPCALATLWRIRDDASSDLLVRFHEELQGGKTELAALRAAQIAFLRSPNPRYRNPLLWSGFRMIGSAI